MSIKVTFDCNGCEAEAPATGPIRKRFESFTGRDYGLGVYKVDSVQSVAPEGWIAFDPYTQCTYCPECLEAIWPEGDDRVASVLSGGGDSQ